MFNRAPFSAEGISLDRMLNAYILSGAWTCCFVDDSRVFVDNCSGLNVKIFRLVQDGTFLPSNICAVWVCTTKQVTLMNVHEHTFDSILKRHQRKLLQQSVHQKALITPSENEVVVTLSVFSFPARPLGSVRSLPSGISRQRQLHGSWQPGAGKQQLPVSQSFHSAQRLQEPRAHQRQLVLRLLWRCVWRHHSATCVCLLPLLEVEFHELSVFPVLRVAVWGSSEGWWLQF